MKKNIGRLIVQIEAAVNPAKKGGFKVTCSEAQKYTNKILVDAVEYNKPSGSEQYVNEEMAVFQQKTGDEAAKRSEVFKKKTEKQMNLDYRLTVLEMNFNFLLLQEVMTSLTYATRKELEVTRPKLIKLENNLSFTLESGDLEPHLEEALVDFLTDLNKIINKTSKIY